MTAAADFTSGPVAPVAPQIVSFCNMSSNFAMPDAFEMPHTATLSSMLPIHANFAGSNLAALLPINGSNGIVCTNVDITVPSLGATL